MPCPTQRSHFVAWLLLLVPGTLWAAEKIIVTPANWDAVVPAGKEVDCIYGDLVLRNEHLVAVIAQPLPSRNANMTVRNVGGAVIDLTLRAEPNDQLSAYYPGAAAGPLHEATTAGETGDAPPRVVYQFARQVEFRCQTDVTPGQPLVTHTYRLADGDRSLQIESHYRNPHADPIQFPLQDAIRADRSFEFDLAAAQSRFTAYDEWWHQIYAVVVPGHQPTAVGDTLEKRRPVIQWVAAGAAAPEMTLAPGSEYTLVRQLIPARNPLELLPRLAAIEGAQEPLQSTRLQVVDAAGPVANALVRLFRGADLLGSARTDDLGGVETQLPAGEYRAQVESLGRPGVEQAFQVVTAGVSSALQTQTITVAQPGYVRAQITDPQGRRIPCKVEFRGRHGTLDPDFGPDTYVDVIRNLVYTPNGQFRQELGPGEYDVIISHGPEFDAVFTTLTITAGSESTLAAQLVRSIDTAGWISSDFHSHSTPSGDNTSSQAGRVLNLLAEHIEFAPCTEHNRISTYLPHLVHYQATDLMATCSGMELTGQPLPVNHQNAFPLIHRPRTQDGGGPPADENPVVQIERLAFWDQRSQKVVQGNHPNLMQVLGDRDLDGQADGGFERMLAAMDVVEVHPPQAIFDFSPAADERRDRPNRMFNWLQLLNQGYRIPGVVNTDAHYNFHGSGWLRNYLKAPTDDPAQITTADMVQAAEAGHITMTNGPFLEVTAESQVNGMTRQASPGDDLVSDAGRVTLQIRVQCANWYDINRVQVFLNGRPAAEQNYGRQTHPAAFATGTVRFSQELALELAADTHVVVAAIGEGLQLGLVVGPDHQADAPIAVSNPIFVDVDANGFQPNGDSLGLPLPLP